jgi:hypothetical protein
MKIITLSFLSLFLFSCVQPPVKPQRSQLEMREMQTRSYTHRDTKNAMKAVINALLDEGFIVKNADRDLGFISASKELDISDADERFWAILANGQHARYKKSSIIEASVSVTEFGRDIKVRVIFQIKTSDNFGRPLSIIQVDDPLHYQDFFSKVDKSLFYEKERL